MTQEVRIAIAGFGFRSDFIPVYRAHAAAVAACQQPRTSSTRSPTGVFKSLQLRRPKNPSPRHAPDGLSDGRKAVGAQSALDRAPTFLDLDLVAPLPGPGTVADPRSQGWERPPLGDSSRLISFFR